MFVSKKLTTTRYYFIEGIIIKISSNSLAWINSVEQYLSLRFIEETLETVSVDVQLLEAYGGEELDRKLPLPESQFLSREGSIYLGQVIPYCIFVKDNLTWYDFKGFGRFIVDRRENRLQSVRLINRNVSAVFYDLIFVFNPLVELFSNFGYMTVHASCVQVNGKGLLFTGKGGSGKSTAAYAMLRRGHTIITDDRALLLKKDGYTALSLTDVIKHDLKKSKNFFPELPNLKPLYRIGNECYYKVTALDNLSYLNTCKVNYLLFFERTENPESSLEKVNPAQAIGEIFPVTLSIFKPDRMSKKFELLVDFMEQITCYKVCYGSDMELFAECIEGLTESGRS